MNQGDRAHQENHPRRKKGVIRMENIIKILVTLDYMVIKAIGGMEIRRVYSSLMAGTPSFEKQGDVRNGCTQTGNAGTPHSALQ